METFLPNLPNIYTIPKYSKHIQTFPRMISHDHIILRYFAILYFPRQLQPGLPAVSCMHCGTSLRANRQGVFHSWATVGHLRLSGHSWQPAGLPRSKMKTLKGTSVAQASVERHLMREVGLPYSKCCWVGCHALNSAGLAWQPAEQHCRRPQKAADILITLMIIQTDLKFSHYLDIFKHV